MLRKRLIKALVLLPCILMVSGCWDSRDINDRDILTAVIVDKTDNGYAFYVEVPPVELSQASQNGEFGRPKSVVVKSEGRTLAETRKNLDDKMDRPIFLGAVQTVILTDKMASYDVEEYMQRLRQISDYRKTVDVVVSTDDPMKLLQTSSEHSASPGTAIYDTIESLINQGQLFKVPLMEILERLSSPYKRYNIPTFSLVDGDLTFTGLSVFSGGMKTGVIPAAYTNSIVFMQAKNAKFLYTVPYKDQYAVVEVLNSSRKIKPEYDGNRVSFDMNLKFKGVLLYTQKSKPVREDDMALIQATLEAMLKKEFSETFQKSQTEYHFDCYSLCETFQNVYPEVYKRMDWAGEYDKASLNLSIKVNLQSTDFADYRH